MKNYLYLAACLLLAFSSCNQEDRFTGLWNKNINPEFDATAFPSWSTKGKYKVDTNAIKTPLFIRIKKEIGFYVMNCYQFDAPKNEVVADPSVFDYVKFTKVDEYTLLSDNRASNIVTSKRITIQLDPATGNLIMNFPADEVGIPTDKRTNALFHTMFSSGFHKVMEIRRKAENANLIDSKLKSDHLILSQ